MFSKLNLSVTFSLGRDLNELWAILGDEKWKCLLAGLFDVSIFDNSRKCVCVCMCVCGITVDDQAS